MRCIYLCVLSTAMSVLCGCQSNNDSSKPAATQLPVAFVRSPASVLRQCRETARAVTYAAPCPMLLPRGLVGTSVRFGRKCRPLQIVGVPCPPPGRWKGWIVGSVELASPREHLVITASPRPVRDYAKVVNGPGWYPAARVVVGSRATIHRWRGRWVYVPPATNDGSAFAGHVVFVWTSAGHTYAAGFHDVSTRRETRALDLELVRHMRLVDR
jgi:hypothetical protein